MIFKKIYDRINHLILSVQNRNKWFRMLGTSNYVNCSRRNPKRSAKYVYHTGTLVYSAARADTSCIMKEGRISNSSIIRWTFQFRSTSSRKDDLMDIDRVKNRETRNTIPLVSWRRNAKRRISKESMADSYEIKNSVIEWLKIIETKIFVDDGMLLWMKITLTRWLHKNITITRVTGGFIRTSKVPILCQWRTDLTSNRYFVPCNNCNKKAEGASQMPTYSHRNQQWAQSSSSTWWNWQGSWWTPYPYESHDEDAPSTDRTVWLVQCSIWKILLDKTFLNSSTLLQMDRLQLTAVYCNRRGV